MNNKRYAIIYRRDELYHYSVPGMKWGHHKARPMITSVGRRFKQTTASVGSKFKRSSTSKPKVDKNSPEHQAKVAKRKKAAKIGAAVVGTALATYGTYKLAKYIQQTRSTNALNKAEDYLNNHWMRKVGESTFADGSKKTYFSNDIKNITVNGSRSKEVGRHNAKIMSEARSIYNARTNTKLDRGLAKVVNAGDTVGNVTKRATTATGNATKRAATATGNATKRAASAVGNTARNTTNRVLDKVNPLYEYVPTNTTTRTSYTRDANSIGKVGKTVTTYTKKKVRRR